MSQNLRSHLAATSAPPPASEEQQPAGGKFNQKRSAPEGMVLGRVHIPWIKRATFRKFLVSRYCTQEGKGSGYATQLLVSHTLEQVICMQLLLDRGEVSLGLGVKVNTETQPVFMGE